MSMQYIKWHSESESRCIWRSYWYYFLKLLHFGALNTIDSLNLVLYHVLSNVNYVYLFLSILYLHNAWNSNAWIIVFLYLNLLQLQPIKIENNMYLQFDLLLNFVFLQKSMVQKVLNQLLNFVKNLHIHQIEVLLKYLIQLLLSSWKCFF